MSTTFWIMIGIASVMTTVAYLKSPSLPLEGLRDGGEMFWGILPTMVLAFIAAGMISKVMPREFLARWMGDESGLRGLVVGAVAGSITPGGPFIQFPIVVALLKSGAGVGPLMAYISAWSLLGINRLLVYEIPLLGSKLALCRIMASLVFPIVIGMITRVLWARI